MPYNVIEVKEQVNERSYKMLYSEFVTGTGCKDNEHNYKVYKDLEIMYMNSDMSKAEVYEYGKKLVDNSKSKEQIEFEEQIKAEIEDYKRQLAWYKEDVKRYREYIKISETKEEKRMWRDSMNDSKGFVKECKSRIESLKWVLA